MRIGVPIAAGAAVIGVPALLLDRAIVAGVDDAHRLDAAYDDLPSERGRPWRPVDQRRADEITDRRNDVFDAAEVNEYRMPAISIVGIGIGALGLLAARPAPLRAAAGGALLAGLACAVRDATSDLTGDSNVHPKRD